MCEEAVLANQGGKTPMKHGQWHINGTVLTKLYSAPVMMLTLCFFFNCLDDAVQTGQEC